MFPGIQVTLPEFQFMSRTSGIGHHWKEPWSIHCLCTFPPGIYLQRWDSPQLSHLQAEQSKHIQPFLTGEGLQFFASSLWHFSHSQCRDILGRGQWWLMEWGCPGSAAEWRAQTYRGCFLQTGVPRRGKRISPFPHTATASMNEWWQVSGQWGLSSPHAGFSRFSQFFSPFCQVKITYFPGTLSLVMWEEPPVKKTPGKFSC